METFPDIDVTLNGGARAPSPLKSPSLSTNGNGSDRWRPVSRTDNGLGWSAAGRSHIRQKSINDAFRTIRSRKGSVDQNAHEIADALRAPISPKLIILCVMWYASSALTNTSSKSILIAFDMPATLTLVQFAFVSSLCIFMAWTATLFPVLRTKISALKYPIRPPTKDVIMTTAPLAAFQIVGHLLSSTATSKIPVSLVHTIKGLSPLFTVLAYRLVYDIRYPKATYLSLVPLTFGVMLACSGKNSYGGQLIGVIDALLATIIFVTQNIFSKKLFNEAAKAEAEGLSMQSKKLDKLNLLCYSSGMAFIFTVPIWFWGEGITLLRQFLSTGSIELKDGANAMDHGRLALEFVFNGVTHFGQNILAFVLLSIVSPVTYSVASLIKRVFVIVMALLWFRSPTTPIQAVGIALTFLGLYLYDRANESSKADKKARTMETGRKLPLLPITTNGASGPNRLPSPLAGGSTSAHPYNEGYRGPEAAFDDTKKNDDVGGRGRQRGNSTAGWLAPGTKQEETWRTGNRTAGK